MSDFLLVGGWRLDSHSFRTDADNRLNFITLFRLFPDLKIKFVMNGRHINFKYANVMLKSLLVSKEELELEEEYKLLFSNQFLDILKDLTKHGESGPSAVRDIFVGHPEVANKQKLIKSLQVSRSRISCDEM